VTPKEKITIKSLTVGTPTDATGAAPSGAPSASSQS
jgi:hypothetical protein